MAASTCVYWGFNFTTGKIQTAAALLAATTATDTFTANAHGLANGTPVTLLSIGSMTNVAVGTTYYVVSSSTNTFKIAASVGGSAITVGTGAPNVIAMVETSIQFPEKLELKGDEETITFNGGGNKRNVYMTSALTAEMAPDCLNIAAASVVFSKNVATTSLPGGATAMVWFGEKNDTVGVPAGLWAEGSAIKKDLATGLESRVDVGVWVPLGTLTLGGGPSLETVKKAGQQLWRLGANRTTTSVIGGALPGVDSGGAFYAIFEK